MPSLDALIHAIPAAAQSRFALVAYVVAVVGSVTLGMRVKRNRSLLRHIESFPPRDRRRLVQAEMNAVIPDNITAEQWIQSKNQAYYFYAAIFLLSCITFVAALAIVYVGKTLRSEDLHISGSGPAFSPPKLNGRFVDGCIVSSSFPVAENQQCVRSAQQLIATVFCNVAGYKNVRDYDTQYDGDFEASVKLYRDLGPDGKLVQQWLEDNHGGYVFSKITCS